MSCQALNNIENHANADNQAQAEAELNLTASADLFIHGEAEFSHGEVELWEVVSKAFEDEQELIKALVLRLLMDDLTAKTELRLLATGIAAQKNSVMKSRY